LCARNNQRKEAAVYYSKAAEMARNFDRTEALKLYLECVKLLDELHLYSLLAKVYTFIGDMLEQDSKFEEAFHAWNKRAEYIRKENGSTATIQQALTKAADAAALAKDYSTAIKMYETIAFPDLDDSFKKYPANELLFRALLCHMAQAAQSLRSNKSSVNAFEPVHIAFERYKDESLLMPHLKDYGFFNVAIPALQSNDASEFTTATENYAKAIKLTNWKVAMICEIADCLQNTSMVGG
jgi:tetratricopeptide (TPR) repeat protein